MAEGLSLYDRRIPHMRLLDREIAEAVEDRLSAVEANALHQVRMMAKDGVGTSVDRGTRHLDLDISASVPRTMWNAPVQRHQNDIGRRSGRRGSRRAGHRGRRGRHGCGCAPGCRAGHARSARRRYGPVAARTPACRCARHTPPAGSNSRRSSPPERHPARSTARRACARPASAPASKPHLHPPCGAGCPRTPP